MKAIRGVGVLAACALLAACGGAGSSGSSSPQTTPTGTTTSTPPASQLATARSYDALHAWTNLHSTTRDWTVTGVASDAKTYELMLSVAPGGSAVFPVSGVTATLSVFRNVIKEGATLVQDLTNERFLDAQYRPLGSRLTSDAAPTTCSKTEVIAALPLAGAPAGTSGPMYAATTLADCSAGAATLGTSYNTWSLLDEGGVVYFCVTASNRFIGEASEQVSETCIQTDSVGVLGAKARIRLVRPGFSLTASN